MDELHQKVGELAAARHAFAALDAGQRRDLVVECLSSVSAAAEEWVAAGCHAKGPPHSPFLAAEERLNGPAVTLRFLQLTRAALNDLARGVRPRLPGTVTTDGSGRVCVPVLPTRGLFDALNFLGFRAHARMLPDVTLADLKDCRAPQSFQASEPSVALILGAGNVSSIPLVDTLSILFQQGQVALLKLNPVNAYLEPIFERALAPLITRGYVKMICGGSEVGSAAIGHPGISRVHMTGSAETHDAIVWGPPGEDRERRKREQTPLLQKPITSELGNVSPWLVVPGKYSERQLAFQAENIAASITNNVSFNCVATKLIVTSRQWTDRSRFLDLIQHYLAETPPRKAYYPGAAQRYRRFALDDSQSTDPEWPIQEGTILPWTLRRDIDPGKSSHLLAEESFVCVCAETALDAASPEAFLREAVRFVNEDVWGTLCVAMTVPPDMESTVPGRQAIHRAVDQLRYGAVCINQWPALVYAMMSLPWGGYPGSSLADVQSGRGWVHNAYMLQGVEKSVLRGPLTVFPKPVWFSSHPSPDRVALRMMQLYAQPTWAQWGMLLANSLGTLLPVAGW